MSKRFFPLKRITVALCTVLALLLSLSQPTLGANSIFRIAKVHGVPLGQDAYVSITVENQASLRSFGGFDFLIGYDASGLTLQNVTQGALLDSCGWEYFSYRMGSQGNCGGPCPSGMVRIVALAETNNGSAHPSCFFEGKIGELARVKFLVTSDPSYNCIDNSISFYWLDCGDNVMSSLSGDTLYLSRRVFEFSNQFDITGQQGYGGWQGIDGSPTCLTAGPISDTALDFYNGEVEVLCIDSIDQRGDINLNGIANEIADLVMFTNYFLSGLSAFTSGGNVNASIAATDVNADGMTLTYQDLVYLDRIVIGDALPFPKSHSADSLNAYFTQDTTNHTVEVSYPGHLAGAFIMMRGNVTPTFSIPYVGWGTWSAYDGVHTRILIVGDPQQPFDNGVWFTYQGIGVLDHVETTDWFNKNITAHISGVASLCGDVNLSGNYDISDAVYLIRYIFGGGPAPLDSHGGDVNCDGVCDISDAVYMLYFIFTFGPAPCNGCK